MKAGIKQNRKILGLLLAAAMIFAGICFPAGQAKAATGTVYTCTIVPCYKHPVTGTIEDSGGEASYATGQGMVEGCVYQTGILEVTSDGKYYLTIRMSLMDYTSKHSFQVQTTGASGWSNTVYGQTGKGSDSNGTTADICIQVPSEKCIVRGTMYVEPMGRDVVFYAYPNNFKAGNSTNMKAAMVTESASTNNNATSGNESAATQSASGNNSSVSGGSSANSGSSSTGNTASANAGSSNLSSGNLTGGADIGDTSKDQSTDSGAAALGNNDMTAVDGTDSSAENSEINSAEGLSLSTAEDTESDGADGSTTKTSGGAYTVGEQIAIRLIPPLVAGVALIAVAAAVVFFFHKNWYRWGGGEDDDDED